MNETQLRQRGTLAVISGFSGVGKGTVMRALVSAYEGYALSVSCTTRAPREGEIDGVSYFFLTAEAFEEMIQKDEFIEHARYLEHCYGTPRPYVEQMLREGKDVLLEIEIQGALQIKEQYPDAVLIFLMPPNAKELLARLSGRGTEAQDIILARLKRAAEEAEGIESYDYVFVNDTPEACAARIHALIQSRKAKTKENLRFIETVRNDLGELLFKMQE